MIWRVLTAIFLFLFSSLPVFSQRSPSSFSCEVTYNHKKLELNKNYWNTYIQDSVRITTCRFYLSQLALWSHGKKVYDFPKKHYLVDLEQEESEKINIDLKAISEFDELHFVLGIDSETNAGGAQGQDLDPIHGMYWAWQSGYIHFKLEGISATSMARNHEFQYHLGGFEFPNNTIQHLHLPVKKSNFTELILPLENIFRFLDLQNKAHIMSPGKEAVQLSEQVAHLFYLR